MPDILTYKVNVLVNVNTRSQRAVDRSCLDSLKFRLWKYLWKSSVENWLVVQKVQQSSVYSSLIEFCPFDKWLFDEQDSHERIIV